MQIIMASLTLKIIELEEAINRTFSSEIRMKSSLDHKIKVWQCAVNMELSALKTNSTHTEFQPLWQGGRPRLTTPRKKELS